MLYSGIHPISCPWLCWAKNPSTTLKRVWRHYLPGFPTRTCQGKVTNAFFSVDFFTVLMMPQNVDLVPKATDKSALKLGIKNPSNSSPTRSVWAVHAQAYQLFYNEKNTNQHIELGAIPEPVKPRVGWARVPGRYWTSDHEGGSSQRSQIPHHALPYTFVQGPLQDQPRYDNYAMCLLLKKNSSAKVALFGVIND